MKKTVFLFCMLFVVAWSSLYAQWSTPVPVTPFNEKVPGKRVEADTIWVRTYDANGEILPYATNPVVYYRSEDGVKDTVVAYSGAINCTIYEYDPNGRLISEKDCDGITKYIYEYDEKGRVLSFSGDLGSSILYDYETNKIIRAIGTPGEKVSEVIYTENGYEIKTRNQIEQYIFDEQGRLIRGGNSTYEYHADGYTHKEGDRKTVYVLDEEGFVLKRTLFRQQMDIWQLEETIVYEYIYKEGNPQSTKNILPPDIKLYGTKGVLIIETAQNVNLSVYTFTGQKLVEKRMHAGNEQIPLPKGIYVIQVNDISNKIGIR